jgi:hypothetical protein
MLVIEGVDEKSDRTYRRFRGVCRHDDGRNQRQQGDWTRIPWWGAWEMFWETAIRVEPDRDAGRDLRVAAFKKGYCQCQCVLDLDSDSDS